jgi:uncharacterized protein (DUF885 family)
MRRLSIAGLILTFFLCPLLNAQTATAPPDSLESLAQDFWQWRAATQPYSSDDIPRIERPGGPQDWSRGAMEKNKARLAEFEARWKKCDGNSGTKARQVDYRLVGSALARVRWELFVNPRWKRDPNFYVEQTLVPLVEALVVPAPLDAKRSQELLTRIRNIPQIVTDAETNLENPPAPFAKVAAEALEGVAAKLSGMTESLAPVTTLEAGEWAQALAEAGKSLEQYRAWLLEKLPQLPRQAALGRQAYVYFLKNVAILPYSPEQLLTMSHQERARTVAFEIYEAGRDRNVAELKIFPDTAEWIRKETEDEAAIRVFLDKHDVLSVPAAIRHYTFRPMPDYLRAVSAFAETDDLTGPSRLAEEGIRYVNPPSDKLGFFWLATAQDPRPILVHEGVPGHYFQLADSWSNPDAIRRHYYDSGANEGIGFYAEELMLQAGLFDDSPHTREIIYHFMRLRALRVEVDVKLALGEFSLEQAAAYLEQQVPMDRGTARSEAIGFATAPGQAISYQVGKIQILEFLAEAKRQLGSAFSLRKFHDSLWLNGNVPIALQRWEMLGPN